MIHKIWVALASSKASSLATSLKASQAHSVYQALEFSPAAPQYQPPWCAVAAPAAMSAHAPEFGQELPGREFGPHFVPSPQAQCVDIFPSHYSRGLQRVVVVAGPVPPAPQLSPDHG